ncbi:MAG: family 78 glycoside hydrolase catalytic domain [Oliverpabstia sp.]
MLEIYDFKCAGLKNPVGIHGNDNIRFSWKLVSENKGTSQKAYRFILSENHETIFDSGKSECPDPFYVLQNTAVLKSGTIYQAHILVEDKTGEIAEADSTFVIAKKPSEWKAKWIGIRSKELDGSLKMASKKEMIEAFLGMVNGDNVSFKPDRHLEPVRIFRKEFETDDTECALLSITAHGVYEARINGQNVTDTCLNPGFTAYQEYLEVQTFDVTKLLQKGKNVLTVEVADGWYKGKYGILGYGNNYGLETGFLAQLDIAGKNGEKETVISDSSFTYTESCIQYADFLIGEEQDTRVDDTMWYCVGADTSLMRQAEEKDYGFDNLRGIADEPVRCVEKLSAKNIFTSPKGECIVDMGQNMVGVVEIRVRGNAGEQIQLEHSEVLDEDGNFLNNISGANRDQTDIFILNGKEQLLRPKFTFHGFRYIKISGNLETLSKEDVTGIVLGSDLETTGEFSCSDIRLNQLQSNIFWSQRGNMLSIPTDCPQRERAGWTGDIQVYCRTAAYNQNTENFLRKWLKNAAIEQFSDGQIPVTVPYPLAYSAMQKNAFGSDTSAGWGDAVIMVPWTLYQVYGDVTILYENWDMMKKWMNYVEYDASEHLPEYEGEKSEDWFERQKYLWNTGFHFGDWLYPSCKNEKGESDMFRSAYSTKEYVATAMYAQSTDQMAQIAAILGKEEEENYYKVLNEKIRMAYAAEYISDDGSIGDAPQGVYVLALAMKMGNKETLKKVAAKLVEMIHSNGDHLDTGFLSIPYLMDVLMEYGYIDTTRKLLYQDSCPSWLYEVKNGATTMWERWDAILENGKRTDSSYNHYAFGCIGDWMYRTLLGFQNAAPGYKKVKIQPNFSFGLTHAEGTFESIYGTYKIRWKLGCDEENSTMEITVPVGAEAQIVLPGICETVGSGTYYYRFTAI